MPRVRVAHTREIPPGERRLVIVAGIEILLFNVYDTIYATGNSCPHEEVELSGATLDDRTLTCWEHGYEMRIDSGECLTDRSLCLPTFPVTIVGEDVHVDL